MNIKFIASKAIPDSVISEIKSEFFTQIPTLAENQCYSGRSEWGKRLKIQRGQ